MGSACARGAPENGFDGGGSLRPKKPDVAESWLWLGPGAGWALFKRTRGGHAVAFLGQDVVRARLGVGERCRAVGEAGVTVRESFPVPATSRPSRLVGGYCCAAKAPWGRDRRLSFILLMPPWCGRELEPSNGADTAGWSCCVSLRAGLATNACPRSRRRGGPSGPRPGVPLRFLFRACAANPWASETPAASTPCSGGKEHRRMS